MAIDQFGVPSRVRCDHGGEDTAVCLLMGVFQGPERGSALRGRSTHNQRIERLWRDIWNGLSNVYHSPFTLLEHDGILDCNNEMHLCVLTEYQLRPASLSTSGTTIGSGLRGTCPRTFSCFISLVLVILVFFIFYTYVTTSNPYGLKILKSAVSDRIPSAVCS